MIDMFAVRRLCLVEHRVSFARAHDGLLAEAYKLELDPMAGDLLLFIGRDRCRIKILFADNTGLWLLYKRFHRGSLPQRFPWFDQPSFRTIDRLELCSFIEAVAISAGKRLQPWGRVYPKL